MTTAETLIDELTLEEQVLLLSGQDFWPVRCRNGPSVIPGRPLRHLVCVRAPMEVGTDVFMPRILVQHCVRPSRLVVCLRGAADTRLMPSLYAGTIYLTGFTVVLIAASRLRTWA